MEHTAKTANNSYYSLSQTGKCLWGLESSVFPSAVFPCNPLTQKGLCDTVLFHRPPSIYMMVFIWSPMGRSSASPTAALLSPATLPEIFSKKTLSAAPYICFLSPQKAWQRKLLDEEKFPLGSPNTAQIPPMSMGPETRASPPLIYFLVHLLAQVYLYNSTSSLQFLSPWRLWKT